MFWVNRSASSITLRILALVSRAPKSRSAATFFWSLHVVAHRCHRYVEAKYKLEIGAAQNTQLAKAISTGAEKGTFVLPKGAQFFIAPLRSGFNSGIVQVSAAR
jgi:hypothetical protein